MWSDDPELGRGRQTIIGSPNQLFPLQEGNVIAYSVRGSSENAPAGWQDEHRCIVAGQEAVEVKAGRYDTFRVDCQRKDYRDTYFYAPTVQNYVLRLRQFGNRDQRKELVSVSLANDRRADAPAAAPTAPIETTPVGAPTPPMPAIGEDGRMTGEPGMADGAAATALVARLEGVVTRLERLAGMPAAPGAGAARPPAAGSGARTPAAAGRRRDRRLGGAPRLLPLDHRGRRGLEDPAAPVPGPRRQDHADQRVRQRTRARNLHPSAGRRLRQRGGRQGFLPAAGGARSVLPGEGPAALSEPAYRQARRRPRMIATITKPTATTVIQTISPFGDQVSMAQPAVGGPTRLASSKTITKAALAAASSPPR